MWVASLFRRATTIELMVRYRLHSTEPPDEGSGIFPPELFARCFQTSVEVPTLPTTSTVMFRLKLGVQPFYVRSSELMWDDYVERYVVSNDSAGYPEVEYQALLQRFIADPDWKEYRVP